LVRIANPKYGKESRLSEERVSRNSKVPNPPSERGEKKVKMTIPVVVTICGNIGYKKLGNLVFALS
jgi:hypothetical protein